MKGLFTILLVLVFISGLFAQDPQTSTKADSTQDTSPTETTREFAFSGYVEAYYVHDFTAPRTDQERPGFLYNHKRNREINLNHAYLKGAYSSEWVRSNLALQVGTYAQYNYAQEQSLIKNIYEANVGIKISRTADLWLDAGILPSHIGFESAVSQDCWTLTRSMVAENSPYYLAGAKLTYTQAKLTALASVVNGWQRVQKLPGYTGPAVSTQIQFRASPNLTFNWSSFLGSDRPDSLQQGRLYTNFYAIINEQKPFGLILGFDIGSEQRPVGPKGTLRDNGSLVWLSPLAIVRLKTSSRGTLNGRVEYYQDPDEVIIDTDTPNGFQTWGYSIGYGFAIRPNALFRIEGKVYQSKDAIFESSDGLKKTNASLTTSLAVSF